MRRGTELRAGLDKKYPRNVQPNTQSEGDDSESARAGLQLLHRVIQGGVELVMVASVSSPMLERRKVVPLIFP